MSPKPHLFILTGYIGVGKTTTARMLGDMLGAPVASVDQIIHRLFGQPSNMGKDAIFSPEELKICYNTFALIAEYMLSAGSSLVVDGGFAKKAQRDLLIGVAQKLNAPFHVLHLVCPEDIVKERASKRFESGQGVGWNGYLQLKKIYEPLEKPYYTIDTSKDVRGQLEKFLRKNMLTDSKRG
jgi:predicted kinase